MNPEAVNWLLHEAHLLIGNPDNGHGECQTNAWQEAARYWREQLDYWLTDGADDPARSTFGANHEHPAPA